MVFPNGRRKGVDLLDLGRIDGHQGPLLEIGRIPVAPALGRDHIIIALELDDRRIRRLLRVFQIQGVAEGIRRVDRLRDTNGSKDDGKKRTDYSKAHGIWMDDD